MEYVPTCIECFYRKQTFHFADAAAAPVQDLDAPIPHIAIGDSEGGVHVIKLHVEFGLSTEVGMKKKNQILFAQSVEVSRMRCYLRKGCSLTFILLLRTRYCCLLSVLYRYCSFYTWTAIPLLIT
jgi:hypothetical protein